MRKNPSSALWTRRNKRGTQGSIAAVIIAFLFGMVTAIGGLIGSGFFIATRYTIKQGANAVGKVVGTDIDYSEYVSEEYANKTVVNALKDLYALAQKGTALSLSDLNAVSPAVGTQIGTLISTLQEQFSIEISEKELMNTPFADIGAYVSDTLFATELGSLLSSPGVNFLTEENSNYDLLMLICYGKEGTDYDIVNGEVVMAEGKSATTLDDLVNGEDGIVGVFQNLEIVTLFDLFGASMEESSITDSLFYTTDEDGNKVALTVNGFMENMSGGDLMSLVGDVTLEDALGVTVESEAMMKVLAFGSECKYNDDGTPDTTAGDYYIANGEIVMLDGHAKKTLNDLMNDSDFIGNIKISDLMGSDSDSSLMNAIGDWTINDLKTGDFNSLYIADLMGIDSSSSSMMIALAYGSELDYTKTYKKDYTDEETGIRYVYDDFYTTEDEDKNEVIHYQKLNADGELEDITETYIIEDGKFVTINGNNPTTLGELSEGSVIDNMKIGDLMGESDSSLMKAIGDMTIAELKDGDSLNGLYVGDLLDLDVNSSSMMIALAYGSECEYEIVDGKYVYTLQKKDDKGELVYTGDYYIDYEYEEYQENGKTCYKVKTVEEKDENGEPVTKKVGTIVSVTTPTTLKELSDGDVINDMKIGDLMGNSENSSSLMDAISDWTISDLSDNDKFNGLYIGDLMGVDVNSSSMMIALAYGSECEYEIVDGKYVYTLQKKDDNGELMYDEEGKPVYTGDYYINYEYEEYQEDGKTCYKVKTVEEKDENGETVTKKVGTIVSVTTPTTLKELSEGDVINDMKIGDLISSDKSSSLMNAISDWTISDLSDGDKFNELYIADLMGVDINSKSMMIALAYGSECEYEIVNGKYVYTLQKKDDNGELMYDEKGKPVYTGDYYIDYEYEEYQEDGKTYYKVKTVEEQGENGEIVTKKVGTIVSVTTPTTLKELSDGDVISNMKIGSLMGETENPSPLMTAISGWTVNDLNSTEKINGLYVGDLIDTSNGSSALLDSISGWTIGELSDGDKMNTLKLGPLMSVDANSTAMMKAIAYGSECTKNADGTYYSEVDEQGVTHLYQKYDEQKKAYVYTGNYIIANKTDDEGKLVYDNDGNVVTEIVVVNEGSETTLGNISTTIDGLKIGDLIDTSNGSSNLLNAISDWSINDLSDESKINGLQIGQLIEITDDSPLLLQAIGSWAISDLSKEEKINGLQIGQLIEVTEDSPLLLQAIQGWSISDLSSESKINSLKIGQLIEVTDDSPLLLQAIQDWSISDLSSESKINDLKIGQLITVTEDSPVLLQTISTWTIGELGAGTKINNLTMGELIGKDEVEKNFLLKHIANSTLTSLSGDITKIKINDLFEGDIYECVKDSDNNVLYFTDKNGNRLYQHKDDGKYYTADTGGEESSRVMKGTWKYMLTDKDGNIGDYTLTQFNDMVENMQRNIQNATLGELDSDGIISIGNTKQMLYKYDENHMPVEYKTMGELTITQLVDYVVYLTNNT
jgi:hypothetical protein